MRTAVLPASGGGLITRSALPAGPRVVTEQVPGARSVSVGIWVPVGSRDESASVAGASHFLEHLLFKGTTSRTGMQIALTMDAIGGDLNAFTEREHTCYYATVLDRDLDLAIEILADVVLNAQVAAADVEVERNVVLEEIWMRDDDPSDLVHDEFTSALFGDTPLGRPILGSVESISQMRPAQVRGYYRRRYHPEEMVVAAAGNLDHRTVVARVRRAFDGVAVSDSGAGAPARAARLPAVRATTVVSEDTEQANVILGARALPRHDERRFALSVLSAALGGGMSSRLFQSIREERGLAYSVYSFLGSFRDAGQFGVYAGCQPAKLSEVLALIQAALDDLARNGLRPEEIERAKGQLRGGLVIGLEEPGSRMTRIGKGELCYGTVLGVDEVLARIDGVDTEHVRAVAAELFAAPRSLCVVGPYGEHDFDGMI